MYDSRYMTLLLAALSPLQVAKQSLMKCNKKNQLLAEWFAEGTMSDKLHLINIRF